MDQKVIDQTSGRRKHPARGRVNEVENILRTRPVRQHSFNEAMFQRRGHHLLREQCDADAVYRCLKSGAQIARDEPWLQLYVPLNTATDYDKTKAFAHGLAERLEREHPDLIVSRMLKTLRKGKVLIDWSQNDEHKTTVCAYSLRAKARPTVSTPVTWEEVSECLQEKKADLLTFTSDDVLGRVEEHGDLFEPVLTLKQRMPSTKALAEAGVLDSAA